MTTRMERWLARAPVPLARLLARRDAAVELAALLIGRDFRPEVDVGACLAELDGLAAPLPKMLRGTPLPEEQAHVLAKHLYETHGFRGNGEDYYDPRNSYLDEVLARRAGIPITLAIVMMAVGRRAGLVVEGIGFPGHFLARIGGPDGVLVDPFNGGRMLGEVELEALTQRFVGDPAHLHPSFLEPVDTRAIAVRILANLKHAHERRANRAGALLAADRLFDLTGAPEHRRDRGLHALALGSHHTALADLQAYLEARPTARDVAAVRAALRRASTAQVNRLLQ